MNFPSRRVLWPLAICCTLVAILAIGFVSYTEMSVLAKSSRRVQRSYDVLQTLHDLDTALADTDITQRGFLLTQDESYLDQYDAAMGQITLTLTELRRLGEREPVTGGAIDHLAKLAEAKLDDMQRYILALRKDPSGSARARFDANSSKRLMAELRRSSIELEKEQRQLLELHRQEEYRARLASEAVLVTTILLSVLFVGGAAMVSRRFDERRRLLEREIAERQRAEQRREAVLASERAARSDAERATRLKDEFVATLSHELRTPLNAIVGWASILRRDRRPDTVGQGVEVIERNAKLQARMVEDLLDMSRIVSGKLAMDLQTTDLTSVLEAAVAAVRTAADSKGVRLELHSAGPLAVRGDSGRLQQVFWNLLTNAIKFTPAEGSIVVLMREVDSQVEVSVSDTGEGIDPAFLPFVFDRFRQADASTTRRHGGLGLGLSIVKSLVEMHCGSVQAHSQGEGQGTTFTVRLPLGKGVIARPAVTHQRGLPRAELPSAVAPLTDLRILVVDDEVDARTLTQRILEERGAQVLTVGSTAAALETIEAQHPLDVVISDIGMPEQDGYELITRLRSSTGHAARLPAIALTALARAEDRRRALLAGYQMHISKPVDPQELVAAIATVVGREASAPASLSV